MNPLLDDYYESENTVYDLLEDFCENKCNMICKKKEKETKENCIIKKFIDFTLE